MVLLAMFTLLALFSIISILLSADDPHRSSDPRDNPALWSALGRR
jgi:hypothetical protein